MKFTESIAIKAPIERVFEVISDFEAYPDFLHQMEETKVLKRTKASCEVAFTANVVSRIHYTLDMKLFPRQRIEWSLVEGQLMEANDGSWTLSRLEPNLTDATFSVEMRFPFWVPQSLAEATLKSGLPEMMKGFKAEAEKRSSKRTAHKTKSKPAARPAAKKKPAKKRSG